MRLTAVSLVFCSFCCSAATKPVDPLTQAILANDLSALHPSKIDANAKGVRGFTPLMYAAAYGTLDAIKILIDAGADVNAKSDFGSTPLMLAITDETKVKLLVSKGADVNAVAKPGVTPLILAAMADGTIDIVRLLISKGADIQASDKQGNNILIAAANSGNVAVLKLALEKQVAVNATDLRGNTALINAAGGGNTEAVKLLLAAGADVNTVSGPPFIKVKNGSVALGNFSALLVASAYGPAPLVKLLLDAGASVNVKDARGFTPLHLALSSETQNTAIVGMLLAKGATADAKSTGLETPGDWAAKFGNPELMSLLKVSSHPPTQPAISQNSDLRTSTQNSLALLEKTGSSFAKEGGCLSCHNQNITSMVASVARSHGLTVDAGATAERTGMAGGYLGTISDALLLHQDMPGGTDQAAYALFGLAGDGFAPDLVTSAIVRNLAMNQRVDGGWHSGALARVPIEDSDITRTAMNLRCMQTFGMGGTKTEYEARIERARKWLLSAKPVYTEEFDMQLLGLKWAGADPAVIAKRAATLLAKQNKNGGWSQNDYLPEDAYATGQALYSLHEAGALATSDSAYRKGVAYLLTTQAADGSWHVRSRSPKFQPYFQSGFPYDHDQWISSAATGWAAMALALAIEK